MSNTEQRRSKVLSDPSTFKIPCSTWNPVVQVGHSRPGGSRTLTSRIKSPLLCRLSYKPVGIEPTAGFAPALSGLQDRRLSRSSHVGL